MSDHQATMLGMVDNASYCEHLSVADETLIKESVALYSWWYEGSWGPEHDACAILQHVPSGVFGVFREGEDSTGHGCRCSANVDWFPTLENAIYSGLNVDERNEFKKYLEIVDSPSYEPAPDGGGSGVVSKE